MELNIKIQGKNEIQQFISIVQLGLLKGIENGVLTIEEAEGYLFNPYSVDRLEKLQISDGVIDIIRQCCELEDVQSLLPRELPKTIEVLNNKAIDNLKFLPKPSLPISKIIKK